MVSKRGDDTLPSLTGPKINGLFFKSPVLVIYKFNIYRKYIFYNGWFNSTIN
jgi:hypothetical protein